MKDEQVFTIQKTGKRLKFHHAVSKSMIALGVLMILFGSDENHTIVWGCLLGLFGFGYLGITRMRIWWNHK